MPRYLLSIAREDNKPVTLFPGARGERDLVDDVLARIKGVGILRTEARVRQVVREALEVALRDAKSEVVPQ